MTTEATDLTAHSRMSIRRVPFSYSANATAHWNSDKPEFSQVVNAASLAMPFLEPYLVKVMREVRSGILNQLMTHSIQLFHHSLCEIALK